MGIKLLFLIGLLIVNIFALRIGWAQERSLNQRIEKQDEQIQHLKHQIQEDNKVFDQKIKEATKEANPRNLPTYTLLSSSDIRVERPIAYLRDLIRKLFGSHSDEAEAIIQCESGFNPSAYNAGGYYGLFQISAVHIARFGDSFTRDPQENIKVGYEIFKEQGWAPWGCKKNLS